MWSTVTSGRKVPCGGAKAKKIQRTDPLPQGRGSKGKQPRSSVKGPKGCTEKAYRSSRDRQKVGLEAAIFLKQRNSALA